MAALHTASSHVRPPPLTQTDAVTSLLSLGLAAAGDDNPAPIPISSVTSTSSLSSSTPDGALGLSQTTTTTVGTSLGSSSPLTGTSTSGNGKHHRRLGSTGKTRRRLSDAREASTRPLTQHSLLSLASLSISTSPGALPSKPLAPRPTSDSTTTPSGITISSNSTTPTVIPVTLSSSVSETIVKPESPDNDRLGFGRASSASTPIPITTSGKPKKRGVDYKCESCAKIYRHPNCLNKHRWEHTRQWREASKFVLSKHQQVQLLEAAAILSYMGAPSTSLPEDRSEWPSFLSGGSLPKVEPVGSSKDRVTSGSVGSLNSSNIAGNGGMNDSMTTQPTRLNPLSLSTSVPVRMSASGVHGPRMHDFTLPTSTGAGVGIGVVGPNPNSLAQGRSSITSNGAKFPATSNSGGLFVRSLTPISSGLSSMMMDQPGWGSSHIPSSSIRSESSASRSGSRSRSGSLSGSQSRSRSDGSELEPEIEEDIDVDVEIMDADADMGEDDKAFGVQDSMSRTKGYPVSVVSSHPEAVPVPYHGSVGGYPHGSYGSSYGRHGVIQGGREYGSYTPSSYGTANAGNGTPGFGGFSNRGYAHGNGSYPGGINTKPTEYHYGNNEYSSASHPLRGSGAMSQRHEGTPVRPIAEAEAEETMTRKMNGNYERRWDGMEMEVDMDMD